MVLRWSTTLVLAGVTYNGDLFPCMRAFLHALTERNYQGRTVAFIENGTWAPQSGKHMRAILHEMKDLTILENSVTFKSSVKAPEESQLRALAGTIADSMK